MKVVINKCYGGFGLSKKAMSLYKSLKNLSERAIILDCEIERDDPALVETVERLGAASNGRYSYLKIVEIPDGVDWVVEEYDGIETVREAHRTWS